MKNTPRAIISHVKQHPIWWAAGVLAAPPAAMAYNGLLEHLGADRWLVDLFGSTWTTWLVTAFVEYFFVLIVAFAMLVLGVRIGQRDFETHRRPEEKLGVAPMIEASAVDTKRPSDSLQRDEGASEVQQRMAGDLSPDDQLLIAQQFLVRATLSRDGHDVV